MDEQNQPEKLTKLHPVEQQSAIVAMMKGLSACLKVKEKDIFYQKPLVQTFLYVMSWAIK